MSKENKKFKRLFTEIIVCVIIACNICLNAFGLCKTG